MFADDALRFWRHLPQHREDSRVALGNIVSAVRNAERFVLSPLATETVVSLADPATIGRTRDNLFLPAYLTWIEWAGQTPGGHPRANRHAILLIGGAQLDSLHVGWGVYAYDAPSLTTGKPQVPLMVFRFDLPGGGGKPLLSWIGGGVSDAIAVDPADIASLLRIDNTKLGAFLGAALALISTPRLTAVTTVDLSAVNRKRQRLGRPPILSWKDVRIRIDRHVLTGRRGYGPEGRPLHHVRAYLRIVRGKVQLMSPHLRGNPRFGRITHRYLALRAEDEPGEWQGGVLPAPVILPFGSDGQ